MEKKSNHRANIVLVSDIKPHTNADTLAIIPIGEYQVVVKKDEFKVGDLGVYIQPDSIVPQSAAFKFVWENYEGLDGIVPEKRRRITVRKFRGEWSEGLLLLLSDFYISNDPSMLPNVVNGKAVVEGDDVSELLGITHYDPDAGKEMGDNEKAPKHKRPRSLRGWFWYVLRFIGIHRRSQRVETEDGFGAPVYDVEALKNYSRALEEGEEVVVTEKIHGSNARYVYLNGHMYAGSRTQWKAENSNCIWRRVLKTSPWIEDWCKAHEGSILYGEVTPTQGEKWNYGTSEPQFFAFDIYTPEGTWVSPLGQEGIKSCVPCLYTGPFSRQSVTDMSSGKSTLFNGIREGVVVTPATERNIRGLGRVKLKLVSSEFLLKDNK